jgi:hypothetical protein
MAFVDLKADNLVLKGELEAVKGELKAVSDCCGRVESYLEFLMAAMAERTSDASASPTKKRRVSVSSPPDHPTGSSASTNHPISAFFDPNPSKKAKLVTRDPGLYFPKAITTMNFAELLSKVTLQGVNIENGFGGDESRSGKSKAVMAIKHARATATEDELNVLDLKMVKASDAGYTEHSNKVAVTARAVVEEASLQPPLQSGKWLLILKQRKQSRTRRSRQRRQSNLTCSHCLMNWFGHLIFQLNSTIGFIVRTDIFRRAACWKRWRRFRWCWWDDTVLLI